MRTLVYLSAAALALPVGASELSELQAEIQTLKTQYEQRIQALEQRITAAEQQPIPEAPVTRSSGNSPASFNPQVSLILDGSYSNDNRDGAGAELLEHVDGIHHALREHEEEGHHHALEPGFNLHETELVFSATVDPYFDAMVNLALEAGGGIEVEEAYFTTRSLPAGLQIKAGKFLSGIGYANAQHPHQWSFTDQNLPYAQLLGDHGLSDTGIQLNYLAPTPFYLRLGLEALQGDHNEFFGRLEESSAAVTGASLAEAQSGPRTWAGFIKFGPNLGDEHALQLGLFTAYADLHQEIHHIGEPDEHALEGDAQLWGADFVYKFDAPNSEGQGDWLLQAEYLRLDKDLTLAEHLENPAVVGQQRKFSEDGFYLQALYNFAPRWQVGIRYDTVGMGINEVSRSAVTLADFDASDRWTLAVTRRFSEFSQVRLQYAQADLSVEGEREHLGSWFLQYQHSLGAHGAHNF
jgi:hypothetical protein